MKSKLTTLKIRYWVVFTKLFIKLIIQEEKTVPFYRSLAWGLLRVYACARARV